MAKKLKLNQLIATTNHSKGRKQAVVDEVYKQFQKEDLYDGFVREYEPLNQDDKDLVPKESKPIKANANEQLKQAKIAMKEMFNLCISQDIANQSAKADIVVNDVLVASNVPAVSLIFLDKQLQDMHALVKAIPVLDINDLWNYSPENLIYQTDKLISYRTKKTPINHVLHEATEHHPAQVQVFHEDKTIGTYSTIKKSSRITFAEKQAMLDRIYTLKQAVKEALETANSTECEVTDLGSKVLDYLFPEK